MIQLLKTETFLKLDNIKNIEEIYDKIRDKADLPICNFHAKAGGYIRRNMMAIAIYNGRYGVGITLFYNNPISTRYCCKLYCIFDIEYEGLKKIVSDILNIEIEEGEAKWQ